MKRPNINDTKYDGDYIDDSVMMQIKTYKYSKDQGKYIDQIEAENKELRESLKEIIKGDGAYDMDRLKHASNCIENMKSIALKALNYKNNL